ncbi:MAG: hypothetical protein K9M07_06515 [Simkaniaceae bacterium]|nr:hypothetical protein [Simkaniaceae bacterium]
MAAHNSDPFYDGFDLNDTQFSTPLLPIDEAEDFFDPFSKLNAYLSKRVKEAIDSKNCTTFEEAFANQCLLNYILPEFQEQFPQYRIGETALKRVWNTVTSYYNSMKTRPDLFNANGKIDLFKLIREAINQFDLNQSFHSQHPYSLAHRIAKQVAECCLILNDEQISIENLTSLVWSVMQHLIPRKNTKPQNLGSLTHPIDTKLADLTLKHSHLCQNQQQLYDTLFSSLSPYQLLSQDIDLQRAVSATAAKLKKPTLKIFHTFSKKTLLGIEGFLKEQIHRYLCHSQSLSHLGIVERVISLYRLTAGLEDSFAQSQLEDAIQYIYSLSTNQFTPRSSNLTASIYAFINSELVLIKGQKQTNPLKDILSILMDAYETTCYFPKLNEDEIEDLFVWTYDLIENEIQALKSIPSELYSVLENEVKSYFICQPHDSFLTTVLDCTKYLSRLRESFLTFGHQLEEELKNRCEIFSHQNDLCASLLPIPNHPLIQMIQTYLPQRIDLPRLIKEYKKDYLKQHPEINFISDALDHEIAAHMKIVWYGQRRNCSKSTYHLFLKWHSATPTVNLEHLSNQKLPLVPYRSRAFYSYMKPRVKQSQKSPLAD